MYVNYCNHSSHKIIIIYTALAQEKGHCFVIDGHHEIHFGSLTTVSADNPASCALGGFKESTAAYRMCRQCLSTHEEFSKKVTLYVHVL